MDTEYVTETTDVAGVHRQDHPRQAMASLGSTLRVPPAGTIDRVRNTWALPQALPEASSGRQPVTLAPEMTVEYKTSFFTHLLLPALLKDQLPRCRPLILLTNHHIVPPRFQ